MKNLSTKIIQLSAFLQGNGLCSPREQIQEGRTLLQFLSSPQSNLSEDSRVENPVTIPKEVLYGFRFTITKKMLIAIFKVTVYMYLQWCLAYRRCSVSGLNCRYLKPYIKLKLIGLAIRLYQNVWKQMNCQIFMTSKCESPNHLLNVTCQSEFVFRLFIVFLRFPGQSTKRTCLRFVIFNLNENLQNIFEEGFQKYGVIVQKSLLKKSIYRNKKFADTFLLFICKTSYCQNLRAIKQIPLDS